MCDCPATIEVVYTEKDRLDWIYMNANYFTRHYKEYTGYKGGNTKDVMIGMLACSSKIDKPVLKAEIQRLENALNERT